MEVGGYSEDTVGEDMGVVLKLQKKCYGTSHATFIYEKDGFGNMLFHIPNMVLWDW